VRLRAASIARAAELRQHVLGIQLEELLLPAADLLDVELVKACVLVFADLLEVWLEVGAARDRFGDHLLCDELGGLLEVRRRRQDLRELAAERVVRPERARCSSSSQQTFIAPATSRFSRPASLRNFSTASFSGETVHRPSPIRAASSVDFSPNAEIRIGGVCSGRS
jgi:hypothetical protein